MIYIEVESDDDLENYLGNLENKLTNMKPLTSKISTYMMNKTSKGFINSSGPEANDWWNPLKKPRPDGSTKPILVKTGALKNSFSVESTENTASIGSPIFYASFHNNGTINMAQRQILPIDKLPEQWEDDISEMITDYLKEI